MLLSQGMQLQVSFLGVLFLGGAVVSALLYTIMLKKLSATYSPLNIIGIQNFIGIFLFLPLFLIFEFPRALSVTPNREIISSFLMLAILASSLSFVFFAHTVKILGIIKANIFSNLIPVFTALFSFWILDESFTMQKIIGIVIVILGVYITEINRKKGLQKS